MRTPVVGIGVLIIGLAIVSCDTGSGSSMDAAVKGWNVVGSSGFSEGGVDYFGITIDGNDVPHVVYLDKANDNKATVMRFNGTMWETVGSPGFSDGGVWYTDIAFDSSNIPYVVFRDFAQTPNGATVMKFDGTNWQTVGGAGFSPGAVSYTKIAINSSDELYVAFKDFDHEKDGATVMKFDGTDWQIVGAAGFSVDPVGSASIAIDGSDTPYVVHNVSVDNKATAWRFDGNDWVIVGDPSFTDGAAAAPVIVLDSTDTPYVVCKDEGNDDSASVYRLDGSDWENVGVSRHSSFAWAVGTPAMVLDSLNDPWVVFSDPLNPTFGPWKPVVMKREGAGWAIVGEEHFSEGNARNLVIAVDSDDNPYVVFTDDAHGDRVTVMRYGYE